MGDQDQSTLEGITTPGSDEAPICRAVIGDRIVISVKKAARAPFAKYPLRAPVVLMCRLSFVDGAEPWTMPVPFSGAPVKVEYPIDRETLLKIKTIDAYALPYGHATVVSDVEGIAKGRVSFTPDLSACTTDKPCEIKLYFELVQGVAQFIADEMNRNKLDPELVYCKELNEQAKGPPERIKRIKPADYADSILGHRVRTKYGGVKGFFTDAIIGGGDWDHKPILDPVWGAKERLGDSDLVYFYDIWSNMHFGYVGNAGGFSARRLHKGADRQQQIDSGAGDEQADFDSIQEGFDLYDPSRDVTAGDLIRIVGKHPEWSWDSRKAAWDAKK